MDIVSSIRLCNVPITPINQIDFATKEDQLNYFANKVTHSFNDCKYQSRSSKIKIKGYVDKFNDSNYGYYINTYGDTTKTFFFWIVDKQLIATETTELTIQLDVFQTWLFDFKFNCCMIERCHVSDDTFGANTIPEDFEVGDYVTPIRIPIGYLQGNPDFFIATSIDDMGAIYGKTYSGFTIKYFAYNDVNMLSDYISTLCDTGKSDAIAFIFEYPHNLIANKGWSSGSDIKGYEGVISKSIDLYKVDFTQIFSFKNDAYIPYNNKVNCYPFNFITLKNANGSNVVLKFENFADSEKISFELEGVLTKVPTFTLTPLNYCGRAKSIDDSISLNNFGLCSWNNDNYANWYANHQNSIKAQSENARNSYKANNQVAENNYNNRLDNNNTSAMLSAIDIANSTLTALGGGNLGGATSSLLTGGSKTLLNYNQANKNASNDLSNSNLLNNVNYDNTIRSLMASIQDAQIQPNTCKGDTSSCGLDVARDTATFYIEQTKIKPEYARMIDSYFQMYGYKVNKLQVPTFKSRERWNFLKTVNCSCFGQVPHGDLDELNNLFNNGLTVWHNESYMYNYNVKNAIK